MKKYRQKVFIGIGSNIGIRQKHIAAALSLLSAQKGIVIRRVSSFYETFPEGGPPQGNFLNGVIEVKTSLSPRMLLRTLRAAEKSLGRVSRGVRWGPRVIDLDILLYGKNIVNVPRLRIPHPRLHRRLFVLVPLTEIAPRARHPLRGKTAAGMLKELRGKNEKTQPFLK